MTIIPVGKFAALADEIKDVVEKRTGLEVDIVDNELLTKYDVGSAEEREELLNVVCKQALEHAAELGI
jgi:hypothetical protein